MRLCDLFEDRFPSLHFSRLLIQSLVGSDLGPWMMHTQTSRALKADRGISLVRVECLWLFCMSWDPRENNNLSLQSIRRFMNLFINMQVPRGIVISPGQILHVKERRK